MVARPAGFDRDHSRRKLLEECEHLLASQLLSQNRLLRGVHSVKLKNVFRRIHTNSANLFHGRPPLSEIYSDLILARLMPPGAVHTNKWPRSRCHDRCSRKSSCSSPGCGRRRRLHDRQTGSQMRETAEVRLAHGNPASSSLEGRVHRRFDCERAWSRSNFLATAPRREENRTKPGGKPGNAG